MWGDWLLRKTLKEHPMKNEGEKENKYLLISSAYQVLLEISTYLTH